MLMALHRVPHNAMIDCTGEERFKANANQDRVAELELLQNYLKGAVEKLDSAVQGKVAPMERMKKLLMSKDKKAMLLEMAGTSTAVNVPTTLVCAATSLHPPFAAAVDAMLHRVALDCVVCNLQETTR